MQKRFRLIIIVLLLTVAPSWGWLHVSIRTVRAESSFCSAGSLATLKACVQQMRDGRVRMIELTSQLICDSSNICDIKLNGIRGPVYFYGRAGTNAGFRRVANHTYPLLMVSGSSGVFLHNLVFREENTTQCKENNSCSFSTVAIDNSNNITLDNVEVSGSGQVGISIVKTDHLTIQHSKVLNVGMFGVWSARGSSRPRYLVIRDSLFKNNASNAVLVSVGGTDEDPSLIVGNVFDHNHKTSLWHVCNGPCGGGQLLIEDVDYLIVRDNLIKNGWNEDYHVPTSGIELWGDVHNVEISNNDIHGNTGWGIISNYWDVVDIQNVNITGNRVYNNGLPNIVVPGANVNNNCFSPNCLLAPTGTPVPTVAIPTPVCSLTPPGNLSVKQISPRSVILAWEPGDGGDKQLLRLAPDTEAGRNAVNYGCPNYPENSPCLVKENDLPLGQEVYETGDILTPNSSYYFRIVEFKDPTCWLDATATFTTCAENDVNCDGTVNLSDLLHWRALWAAGETGGDVNGDGQKDVLDYLAVLRHLAFP